MQLWVWQGAAIIVAGQAASVADAAPMPPGVAVMVVRMVVCLSYPLIVVGAEIIAAADAVVGKCLLDWCWH